MAGELLLGVSVDLAEHDVGVLLGGLLEDRTELTVETFERPIRFMPHFVLESREALSIDEGIASYRGYLDRLVPAAMPVIRQR